MPVRVLIMAAMLGVTAFVVDDGPAPQSKSKSESKDSAAAKKALKQYHHTAVQAFIEMPGFGHDRMPPMLRTIEDIRVVWTSQDVEEDKAGATVPDLAKAHKERIAGYKRDSWPSLKLPGNNRVTSVHPGDVKQTWKLRHIDLVAVVDHEEPIVYITPLPKQPMMGPNFNHQPASQAARKALEDLKANNGTTQAKTSREPNQLELAALDRFRDGEEVVVRAKGDVLQMVGALRATKQCLECHKTAKEGDLFGAFSYTLMKTPN